MSDRIIYIGSEIGLEIKLVLGLYNNNKSFFQVWIYLIIQNYFRVFVVVYSLLIDKLSLIIKKKCYK